MAKVVDPDLIEVVVTTLENAVDKVGCDLLPEAKGRLVRELCVLFAEDPPNDEQSLNDSVRELLEVETED